MKLLETLISYCDYYNMSMNMNMKMVTSKRMNEYTCTRYTQHHQPLKALGSVCLFPNRADHSHKVDNIFITCGFHLAPHITIGLLGFCHVYT